MIITNNKNKTDSGDDLNKWQAIGTDGSTPLVAASIEVTADAQATDGAVPGKIAIRTANTSGTLTDAIVIDSAQNISTMKRTGRKMNVPVLNAKVGATAGWVITAGTDISHATLPASQTASTLVVPISGLFTGDIVTAVALAGQVESAGGIATITMSVRKLTNVAADNTDAEIGTVSSGNITSDTVLSSANMGVTLGTPETMADGESVYVLLTATTAAATDIDLTHLIVTVTQN